MNRNKIFLAISIILFIGGMLERTHSSDNLMTISTKNQESTEAISPDAIDVAFRGYLTYDDTAGIGDFIEWSYTVTNGVGLKLYLMNWDNIMAFAQDENRIANCWEYWTLCEGTSGSGAEALPRNDHWYLVLFNMDSEFRTATVSQFNCYWHFGDITSITEPDPGEVWEAGQTNLVSWTTTGYIPTVTIDLYKDSFYVQNIVTEYSYSLYVPFGTGEYTWSIPAGLEVSSTYQILIKNSYNSMQSLASSFFTITKDSLTITSPTSSSSWQAGTIKSITWTSTGSISNVDISLVFNGIHLHTFAYDEPNDGHYSWNLASSYSSYNDFYQIKIEDSDPYSHTSDLSDPYFEITEPSPGDSLTITNPIASSSWQAGSTQEITWTSEGSIAEIVIGLFYNDIYLYAINGAGTPNDGSYFWTLPSSFDNYGDVYQIKIQAIGDTSINDFSEYFEITSSVPTDSLTLTSPTASTSWGAFTSQTITWTSTGSITNVALHSYYNGEYHELITSNTANDGSFTWNLDPVYANYDDLYQICIENKHDTSINDFSPAYFEITETHKITITNPTVSSSWEVGSTHTISWTSMGSISEVNIILDHNDEFYSVIAANTANDGSYTWTLDSSYSYYDDFYQIRIFDSTLPMICGTIDSFEITAPKSISITNPIISSSWQAGSTQEITWTSTGSISNVDILLYYNGGYYHTIESNAANVGSYTWTLDSSYSYYADLYQIRIEDSSNSAIYDLSDSYFEITEISKTITITSPISSNSWEAGSTHTITWTTTGSISNVKIHLYHNGVYHSTIIANTVNDGSYMWTLAESYANYDDYYQIYIRDCDDLNTFDYSAAYFRITDPPILGTITISSPTSTSTWQAGSTQTITWSFTGDIVLVDILLYYDGSILSTIVSGLPNDGEYEWTLPSSFEVYSDRYQICIRCHFEHDLSGISQQYFEIIPEDDPATQSPTDENGFTIIIFPISIIISSIILYYSQKKKME